MPEPEIPKGYVVDRNKLDIDYPTQFHNTVFCEELGRTIATFGFIEEMLGKAIFALSGAKAFDPEGDPEAFDAWIKTLEKALTDQLGGLIIGYEKALADNPRTKGKDYTAQVAELREAKELRNALCHGSWSKPDDQGRSTPKFVNRKLLIFETPIDVEFLKQTRAALRHIICDILDSVTSVGYQFPGSDGPGEQLGRIRPKLHKTSKQTWFRKFWDSCGSLRARGRSKAQYGRTAKNGEADASQISSPRDSPPVFAFVHRPTNSRRVARARPV